MPDCEIGPLEPPDSYHLEAAKGWLDLGNSHEANEELEKIVPELRVHPDVLEVRWTIYASVAQWDACLDIATAITTLAPSRHAGWGDRAFSLRKLGRINEARDLLLSIVDALPHWTLCYELARFSCLLERFTEASDWLGKAFDMLPDDDARRRLKLLALDAPDFERLWIQSQLRE